MVLLRWFAPPSTDNWLVSALRPIVDRGEKLSVTYALSVMV